MKLEPRAISMKTISSPCLAHLDRDARLVLEILQRIDEGGLEIRLPDGGRCLCGADKPAAILHIHDQVFFANVLARGDIGLADSYLDGHWDSPDVAALIRVLASNRDSLARALFGRWRALLLARLRHWRNANTQRGSRRNIMAHYDLGNAFYARWLDDSMTYSSALFEHPAASLQEAQAAKYRRILDRLQAQPDEHILEIGCGWGGFAEMATRRGQRLTGITLSPAQLEVARQRVPQADLRLQDYRDIRGCFDHIVSIEMIEAVGERWWPTYFSTLAKALKPTGKAIVQSIIIRDDLFARYRRSTDFIRHFIFPGGMLPSKAVIHKTAERAGLKVTDAHAFGHDYAQTLAHWRQRFEAAWTEIAPLGFDERFRRLWRLYLGYCEGGFAAGSIDVVQFELQHASSTS